VGILTTVAALAGLDRDNLPNWRMLEELQVCGRGKVPTLALSWHVLDDDRTQVGGLQYVEITIY
jgi:hypothetical protein